MERAAEIEQQRAPQRAAQRAATDGARLVGAVEPAQAEELEERGRLARVRAEKVAVPAVRDAREMRARGGRG